MTAHLQILDTAMTTLLRHGQAIPLGVKHDLIVERMTRAEYPATAEHLLGTADVIKNKDKNPSDYESTLLSHYDRLVGYQFSWGMLLEDYSRANPDSPDEWDREAYLVFQIVPEQLYKRFWRPDIWDRVFIALYRAHELEHPSFEECEGRHSESTMEFQVFGEEDAKNLRSWMADVFIPLILPDILSQAGVLLSVRDRSSRNFEELVADLECEGMSYLQMAYAEMTDQTLPIPKSSQTD